MTASQGSSSVRPGFCSSGRVGNCLCIAHYWTRQSQVFAFETREWIKASRRAHHHKNAGIPSSTRLQISRAARLDCMYRSPAREIRRRLLRLEDKIADDELRHVKAAQSFAVDSNAGFDARTNLVSLNHIFRLLKWAA